MFTLYSASAAFILPETFGLNTALPAHRGVRSQTAGHNGMSSLYTVKCLNLFKKNSTGDKELALKKVQL